MYILKKQTPRGFRPFHPSLVFLFHRKRRWGANRALRAILYIVDRKLDLSLLSDHGVLKEGDAAQVDGITGGL